MEVIDYIGLYVQNANPADIVRDVFEIIELDDHWTEVINKLQNDFFSVWLTLTNNTKLRLINASVKYYLIH
jgi:hypothetical protein